MNDVAPDKSCLSRREALRALLAGSGVVAFSSVPHRWESPIVATASLPALAQISPTLGTPPLTSNCVVSGPLGVCNSGGGGAGNLYSLTCSYNDVDGNIIANQAQVRIAFTYPSGQMSTFQETLDPINITGNGTTGTITVPLCIGFNGQPSVAMTISFFDANGLESNQETVSLTAP